MNKKVSIIMGIYNCEVSLPESIDSIKCQTYKNWELIMCDDGSTDKTYEIAYEYAKKDNRIKLIKNSENVGLAKTLNNCLMHCTGHYIMRHDGDDIMFLDRIEKQVNYMNLYNCDVCGSGALLFDKNGVWGRRQPEQRPSKEIMILHDPFIHPTIIMKREKLLEVGGYSVNKFTKQRLEDYDLWLKFYERDFNLHNIQEPLIYFREDKDSFKRKSKRFRITETLVRLNACKRLKIPYIKRILALKPLIIILIPKGSLKKYHIMKGSRNLRNSVRNK